MRISKSILGLALASIVGSVYAIDVNQLPLKSADEVKAMAPGRGMSASLLGDTRAKQFLIAGKQVTVPRAKAGMALDGHALAPGFLFTREVDLPVVVEILRRAGRANLDAAAMSDTFAWTPVITGAGTGIVIDTNPYGFQRGWIAAEGLQPEDIEYMNGNLEVVERYFVLKDLGTGAVMPLNGFLTRDKLKGKAVGWVDCPGC